MRQLADVALGQVRIIEGAEHTELASGLAARPVVTPIVGVAAIGDGGDAPVPRDRGQVGV